MNKTIRCRINGHNLRLKKLDIDIPDGYGKWSDKSHFDIVTHKDNYWPWRHMLKGDCVMVPYRYASYKQIQNAINGYTKHCNGVKFRYRSEASGLTVWCVERKEEHK